MIKQVTQLVTTIKDKEQVFHCDPSASLTDVLEGLNTFRSYVYGRIKEAEEQSKPSEPAIKTEEIQ